MTKIAALMLCLLYSTAPFAQTAVNDSGGSTVAPPTSGTVIAPQAPPPPSTPSINPAANTGQQAENSGAGANNLAGAALIAAGMPLLQNPQTAPMGMALMAMGMLALAQGASDSGAAGQSGNTAAVTAYNANTTPGGTSSTTTAATDSGVKSAFASPLGQQAVAAVAAAGGTLSPAGVTTPDGTTTPLSSFASADGMTAAGFDGAGAMQKVAAIEKNLGVNTQTPGNASGLATAEGTGAGGVPNKFGDMPPFVLPKFKNPFDLSAAQKAQLAADKTVSVGGDPIGVKGDDLFAMIHRAYAHQQEGNNFIMDANGGADAPTVSIRAPASFVRKSQ